MPTEITVCPYKLHYAIEITVCHGNYSNYNNCLVMVLNALEVDPGRVWKSPWRFYHESMLDCCVSLDEIKKTGITLSKFACLAECNKLSTTLNYAQPNSGFFFHLFKKKISKIKKYLKKNKKQIITSHFIALLPKQHYKMLKLISCFFSFLAKKYKLNNDN